MRGKDTRAHARLGVGLEEIKGGAMSTIFGWIISHITEIGVVITAIGVFLAFFTLRANHDWNRRERAIAMAEKWNTQTLVHRKAIERAIPGLYDINKKSVTVVELSVNRATQIYLANPEDEDQFSDWELRFHFIELLNYFEDVALSYLHQVGDQHILDEAISRPLLRWYAILSPFMKVVKEHRGYDAWEAFSSIVKIWDQPERRSRKKTG